MKGRVIVKTPHRVFEIYADRDDAIQAITPKNPGPFEYDQLASSTYRQLSVSAQDCILHVKFVGSKYDGVETLSDLRDDFSLLSKELTRNSKVLLDFQDVEAISPDSIELLVEFNKRLRNKGSRIVLCCIAPGTLESFFPLRKRAD